MVSIGIQYRKEHFIQFKFHYINNIYDFKEVDVLSEWRIFLLCQELIRVLQRKS